MPDQDIHRRVDKAVENILDNYCAIPGGRRALVLCDHEKEMVGQALKCALEQRYALPSLAVLSPAMTQLPAEVVAQFRDADQALLVLASHGMFAGGLAQFLDQSLGEPELAVACHPSFFDTVLPLPSLLRLYGSNVADDRAYLQRLAERLPAHTKVHVTAPGGTDLWLKTRDWQVHPWEVLTSPIEHTATGHIVADVSVFAGQTSQPVVLSLRDGRLSEMHCQQPQDETYRLYQRWMTEALADDAANSFLAEWGWGGNAEAQTSGIIMEDEAQRGTCHFCFGDNTRYGGQNRSDWHGGTVVVGNPRITLEGESR